MNKSESTKAYYQIMDFHWELLLPYSWDTSFYQFYFQEFILKGKRNHSVPRFNHKNAYHIFIGDKIKKKKKNTVTIVKEGLV